MYLFLSTSAPYAIAAFRFILTSPPERPSSLDFLYHTGPGKLLGHATFSWRGTFLSATANSFLDLRLAWKRIFLKRFLFHHATFARRDTFLQAAADFLLDPQYPRVLSLIFWRRSSARLQTLRRFLSPSTGIIAACPLGLP
jgi:hypothetical protein